MVKYYDWHKTQMRERCGGAYVLASDYDKFSAQLAASEAAREKAEAEAERLQQLIDEEIPREAFLAMKEKLEKAEAVVNAARGLSFGVDWNKGTYAKKYRPLLVRALAEYNRWLQRLWKQKGETPQKKTSRLGVVKE